MFRKLVLQLRCKEVSFFVHVDSRVDQAPFVNSLVDEDIPVTFIEKREDSRWGSFGITQATFNLIEHVLSQPIRHRYFVLLSGNCFPIKQNHEIIDFFKDNSKNYLDARPMHFFSFRGKEIRTYNRYLHALGILFRYSYRLYKQYKLKEREFKNCSNIEKFKITLHKAYFSIPYKLVPVKIIRLSRAYFRYVLKDPPYLRTCFWCMASIVRHYFPSKYEYLSKTHQFIRERIYFYNIFLPRKRMPQGISAFSHGSQWWYLREDTVSFMCNYMKKNKTLARYFRYSKCSDERVFQTIFLSTRDTHDYKHEQANVRFKMPRTGLQRYYSSVKMLIEEDYERLKDAPHLFARKIHHPESNTLIEKLFS